MAVTMQQEFEKKMKSLREDGLFPDQTRGIGGGSRYLIVSYGGTGADALFQIRRTMKRGLPKDQYRDYVRFLAIDTDQNTMKQTETVINKQTGLKEIKVTDSLEQQEFLWLDNTKAKDVLETSPELFQDWINVDLPGIIKTNPEFLDGYGASATRQVGRLTLFPAKVSGELISRIKILAEELTQENADELRVMIVTGISGGTGSGTVIDATYLIRHAIGSMPASVGSRTKYLGFVMLPPTGTQANAPIAVASGNRNGCAALKEINQFMTLSARGDHYHQEFGGVAVDSEDNIFDTCYLLDGIQDVVAYKNPRKFVNNVLADCVLDMVTSIPVVGGAGGAPQAVDSLISNVKNFADAMVLTKTHKAAPRDADYIYCVLGHANMEIPVSLIKTYVAKLVLDKMMMLFGQCGNVTRQDAESFFKQVYIPGATVPQQNRRIDEGISAHFRYAQGSKYGPYYMINLLTEAANVAEQESRKMFVGKAKEAQLHSMAAYFRNQNKRYFSIYTRVMDTLGEVLTRDYNLICRGEHTTQASGDQLYTFRPISLASGDNADVVIRKYLDKLITPNHVYPMIAALLNTIIENKDAWSDLVNAQGNPGDFDAGSQLRKFWNTEITKIVDSTVENLLIKVYANDPDAKYDPDDAASVAALKTAAKTIYNMMFGKAGKAKPTAELDLVTGLTEDDFNGQSMMLVPEQAPHLKQELENLAKMNGNKTKVYSSGAIDRISCYVMYTAIPAFKFKWVQRAEKDYEDKISTVGLHMSETTGGNQWRDFPNLLPKSTWEGLSIGKYSNPREAVLAERAEKLFQEANRLNLTKSVPLVGTDVLQYSILSMSAELTPDTKLFKEFDVRNTPNANEETVEKREQIWKQIEAVALEKARTLFTSVPSWVGVQNITAELVKYNKDLFTEHELRTTNAVLAVPAKPAGWDEYIAACFLRKMPDLMVAMRGTVQVMLALEELIRRDRVIDDFCNFVVTDLFYYNEKLWQWEYSDGISQKVLAQFKVNDAIQQSAPYYFLYQEFAKNADAITKDVQAEFDEARGVGMEQEVQIEKQIELNKKAEAVYRANAKKLKFDKNNEDAMSMFGSMQFGKMAAAKGYDVEEIKKFYTRMNDTLVANFGFDIF